MPGGILNLDYYVLPENLETARKHFRQVKDVINIYSCLLYTSDAADERSSVDLGGRRIIKKKKNRKTTVVTRN